MLTPPTQEELSKLKSAEITNRLRGFCAGTMVSIRSEYLADAANELDRLLSLIDAQQKKITDLEGARGFAEECGVPADGVAL